MNNTALNSFIEPLSGMKLLAEVVTLGGRNGASYTYSAVVDALETAGLNTKAAREFLPRNAWSRACRQLARERVIDVVVEDDNEAEFQFSRRFLSSDGVDGGQQIEYRKEVKVLLDKGSGKLQCRDEAVLQMAQRELDRCMIARTNADVTVIARRLFDAHADLMPIPGAVGVYLVPIAHREFLRKVDKFLTELGRKPHIIPVPAGLQESDRTVQETVMSYLGGLIEEHQSAIEGFSESTRNGTFENAARRINETRVKIEAYALYLQDRKEELLKAVEAASTKLRETVERLTEEPEDVEGVVEDSPQETITETSEELEMVF